MTIPFGTIGVQTAAVAKQAQDAAQRRQNILLIVAAVVAFLFVGRAGRGRRTW